MATHNHRPTHRNQPRKKISSQVIFRWTAIILVILLLFWLFVAEDIGAYIGWGND